MSKDAKGMNGYRSRNETGELRRKRSDTHVSTIEQKYDANFGVRSDMHLETLLKQEKVVSLDKLLKKKR